MTPDAMRIAEEIVSACTYTSDRIAACTRCVAAALEKYAEEIKADRDRWADSACRLEKVVEAYKSWVKPEELDREVARATTIAYRQAIEDAAKVAETWTCAIVHGSMICVCDLDISTQIRALVEGKV